jgi:hypothetical protein
MHFVGAGEWRKDGVRTASTANRKFQIQNSPLNVNCTSGAGSVEEREKAALMRAFGGSREQNYSYIAKIRQPKYTGDDFVSEWLDKTYRVDKQHYRRCMGVGTRGWKCLCYGRRRDWVWGTTIT